MTSGHETETNLGNGPAQRREQVAPTSSESAYERLSRYGFAQRYTQGKIVADLTQEEIGYGSRLLAQNAESVTALSELPEAVELASVLYYAPNVSYRRTDLPKLPLPESSFDVVVAFGVIENLEYPEDLVGEAKRILKEGGVLIASTPDKQTDANGGRGMYIPEFQGLLERHFGHVRLYRQGAVAGGFVFPASGEVTDAALLESFRLSGSGPRLGVESPMTRSIMAVCSDAAEALGREERAYLLLDRDRRVFDEYEERTEDVELMRAEIRQMEETEVQAFVEAIQARRNLIRELIRSPFSYRNLILQEIRYRLSIIRSNVHAKRQRGTRGLAKGALRRSSVLYRRLRDGHKP